MTTMTMSCRTKSADGIGVINVANRKLTGKIKVGSDPEEFTLSPDGRKIYVSNEDVKTASIVDIASAKVEHIILVGQEPEGVAVTPDGNRIYVTCETGGDILVVDAHSYKTLAHFKVPPRPRSVDFRTDAPDRLHSLRIRRCAQRYRFDDLDGDQIDHFAEGIATYAGAGGSG